MHARYMTIALAGLLLPPVLAAGPLGRLDLPDFQALERDAKECVNISLQPWMLQSMSLFIDAKDADAAAVKRLLGAIKSVQIRNYEFTTERSTAADLQSVRRQLAAPGWTRLVETHSRPSGEDVDVYLMIDNGRTEGLAVIVSEPRELTIVNVAGPIRVEDLAVLENHLHLPKLAAPLATL